MFYGQLIKEYREKNKLSYRKMTKQMNEVLPDKFQVSFMALYQWENEIAKVPFYTMFYLSKKASGDLKAFAANMCKVMNE